MVKVRGVCLPVKATVKHFDSPYLGHKPDGVKSLRRGRRFVAKEWNAVTSLQRIKIKHTNLTEKGVVCYGTY